MTTDIRHGHFDRNGTGEWHTHDPLLACPIGPDDHMTRGHGRPVDVIETSDGGYRCGGCGHPVERRTNTKRAAWRHLP